MPRLVLASTSPRRRALLAEHGYAFEVVPPEVEEMSPAHLSPRETVLFNAWLKAASVARTRPDAVVLGVDTLVGFEGRMLGKPASIDEAFAMLSALNGREHQVFSGVCIASRGGAVLRSFAERSHVRFHRRSDEELRAYLSRIGPLDKAGAYAAQEDAGTMIAEIEGSFTNVIGLPMEALVRELGTNPVTPRGVPTAQKARRRCR